MSAPGETAAEVLILVCEQFRPSFFDALVGDNPDAHTTEVNGRGWAELVAFALHLSDRIAFQRLGNPNRAIFMDAFLTAVQGRVDSALAQTLPDLYNQRTLFYQDCRMPSGEGNANLKGTLFWEFGKLMASPCHYPDPVYANWNPMAMTQLSLWGMDVMIALVDGFEVADLF